VKIVAIKVKAGDLEPGDLFSTGGQNYWDGVMQDIEDVVGERVYIRTDAPCPEDQADEDIYLIVIERGDEE